ncbi:hypothetical protein CHS0354_008266 [Potamilus streckersoni]|uniref:Uncharacterized protein n=1 Tax=Potamilus streckersoni TaxID=2493646 RepID=A0AAE0RUN2_9BIVA|nr:hypothetical protein CHS0354_008266 [Potamilus streckersoni]
MPRYLSDRLTRQKTSQTDSEDIRPLSANSIGLPDCLSDRRSACMTVSTRKASDIHSDSSTDVLTDQASLYCLPHVKPALPDIKTDRHTD